MLTIEQLEQARELGAVIIASEKRHGRPDEWHAVGHPQMKPEYSCESHEYAVLWPSSVNADRDWKPQ